MFNNGKKELEFSYDFLKNYQFRIMINSFYEACSIIEKYHKYSLKYALAAFLHLINFIEKAEGFDTVLKNLDRDINDAVRTKHFNRILIKYRQTSNMNDEFFDETKKKFVVNKDNLVMQDLSLKYPNFVEWSSDEQIYYLSNQTFVEVIVLLTNGLYQQYIKSFNLLLNGSNEDIIYFLKVLKEINLKQQDVKTEKERYTFERIFYSPVLKYLNKDTKKELISLNNNLIIKLKTINHD